MIKDGTLIEDTLTTKSFSIGQFVRIERLDLKHPFEYNLPGKTCLGTSNSYLPVGLTQPLFEIMWQRRSKRAQIFHMDI